MSPEQYLLIWALPFVLGGAVGNFIDRLIYRFVIDFIDVYIRFLPWRTFNPWPTFNVADIAICVGVGLMIIDIMRPQNYLKPEKSKSEEESVAPLDDRNTTVNPE